MATMYALPSLTTWNGTPGGWSNTSGGPSNGTTPQSGDKVIFDANSGPARAITITSSVQAGNIICTGAPMNISPTGGFSVVLNGIAVNDVFDLSGFTAIPTVQISPRWSGATLKTGSCSISNLTVTNGPGITLAGDLVINNVLQIGSCDLYANGYNVQLATVSDISTSGSGPVVNFGSGTWTFTGSGTLMNYSYWTVQWSSATIKIANNTPTAKTWNYPMTPANKFWVAATGTGTLTSYAGVSGSGSQGATAITYYRIDAGCNVVIPGGYIASAAKWQVAGTSASPVNLSTSANSQPSYVYSTDSTTKFYFDYCLIKDVVVWSGLNNFVVRSSTITGVATGWNVFKQPPSFLSFF